MTEYQRTNLLKGLYALSAQAKATDCLLQIDYQDMVLTPCEAEAEWNSNCLIWGLSNWTLVPCAEYLAALEHERQRFLDEHARKVAKVDAYRARVYEERNPS